MEETPAYAPGVKQSKGSGCGCLVWGLLISLVLIIGSCAGLAFWVKSNLDKVVEHFADTAPSNISEVKVDEATETELLQRVKNYKDQLNSGNATAPLVLSSRDVGVLGNQVFKVLPGLVGRVEIVKDEIVGQVSLSLENFLYPGKWLNGQAGLRIAVAEGSLIVKISSLKTAKGAIPKEIMDQISNINFAESAAKDPEVAEALQKVKELKISNGTLIIVPR